VEIFGLPGDECFWRGEVLEYEGETRIDQGVVVVQTAGIQANLEPIVRIGGFTAGPGAVPELPECGDPSTVVRPPPIDMATVPKKDIVIDDSEWGKLQRGETGFGKPVWQDFTERDAATTGDLVGGESTYWKDGRQYESDRKPEKAKGAGRMSSKRRRRSSGKAASGFGGGGSGGGGGGESDES